MIQNWPLSGMLIPSASRLRGLLTRKLGMIAVATLFAPHISIMLKAQDLIPPDLTVGRNLQTEAQIKLSGPASKEGLVINVQSNDPGRLLLSKNPLAAGSESIQLRVEAGASVTPQFYLQALADSGTAAYTVSAPDHASGKGAVNFVPSALLIGGSPIVTVSGAPPSRITVYSAQMDASGRFSTVRLVRGGFSANVHVVSSEPTVGTIAASAVTIEGGDSRATTQFVALAPGTTTLAVEAPPGFHDAPPMKATVNKPGISISDQQTIGMNLEVPGSVSLGALAPAAGVTVTLTSSDPTRLLLSASEVEVGSKSLSLTIPAGRQNATYFLQALGGSGIVTYNAVAPGYRDRQATITLAPSGIVIGAPLPPDEREVLRPDEPEAPKGFYLRLAAGKNMQVGVFTVCLDPRTRRGADITTQTLRPGLSITVPIANSDPAVGTFPSSLTIVGGTRETVTEFKMLSAGSTVLSVTNPPGYTTPSNSQFVKGIIVE